MASKGLKFKDNLSGADRDRTDNLPKELILPTLYCTKENNMYKSNLKVIAFLLMVLLFCSSSPAYSMGIGPVDVEIKPYLKGGSIAWDELGGIGGHKLLAAAGIDTTICFNNLKGTINFERWIIGEGMDDDRGIIPRDGYIIAADIGYKVATIENFSLYPYTGIGFERWNRDKLEGTWSSLEFFDWTIGLSVEHPVVFGKLGMLFPFSQETNEDSSVKSKPGLHSEIGVNIKRFIVGIFHRFTGFEDPDAKMTQSGIFFGYRFR
jgi:hypothetical protein